MAFFGGYNHTINPKEGDHTMFRRDTVKTTLKRLAALVLNPRLLLCLGLAWMITSGWAYVLFAVGALAHIGWMSAFSAAYIAFLWIPFTPEKLVMLAIAVLLLRRLFPNDVQTVGALREMLAALRDKCRIGRIARPAEAQKD
jgi:hypothetical protein